jgi:hypothetical protein
VCPRLFRTRESNVRPLLLLPFSHSPRADEMSYSLSSRVGWIAMSAHLFSSSAGLTLGACSGFGTRMVDSAMVVMWANADDSVTLLHRAATGDVYPKPTTTTVVPGSTSVRSHIARAGAPS